MLKETFEHGETQTQSSECIADALEPSHVIQISASDSTKFAPEVQRWTAMESLDWRFGEDIPHSGDAKAIGPSLEVLFSKGVQLIGLQLHCVGG